MAANRLDGPVSKLACAERWLPDIAWLPEAGSLHPGRTHAPGARYRGSWLRVSGAAKMPQIDQSVRHQLHTVVALLFELKAQQKPFEFVLPGEGPLHAQP
jgi:hypothetical protein